MVDENMLNEETQKTNLEESSEVELEHKKKHHKKKHHKKHHKGHHIEQKETHDLVMTKTEDKVEKKAAPAPAAPPVAKSLLATKAKNQDDFEKYS
jgi:ParB-like chromosome segregation protein Spo0J